MPCTVVVGGQFGSEGKGKVVALTAALVKEPWVVWGEDEDGKQPPKAPVP